LCLLKSEGKEGSIVYKQLVILLWHYADHRMKSMGVRGASCTYCFPISPG